MATLEEIRAAIAASTLEELGRDVTDATTDLYSTPSETTDVSSQGVGTGYAVVSSQGVGDGTTTEEVSSQGVGTETTTPTETTTVTDTTSGTTTTDTTSTTGTTGTATTSETTTDESEYPEQTTEEKAASYVNQEAYQEIYDLGVELFGEELMPDYSSFDAYLEAFQENQETELSQAEQEVSFSGEVGEQQVSEISQSAASQQAATREALGISREGPMSGTNLDVSSKIQEQIQSNAQIAIDEINFQQQQREQALASLEEAQANERWDLVNQYQDQINNAELAIQQAETDYYNALTSYSEAQSQAQADYRANLSSFTTLVDTGTELSTDALVSLSTSLNLPFETVYSYYQGAEAIRQNKSLSLQEQQIEIQQLTNQFNLEQLGFRTEEAQQVAGYLQLVQDQNLNPTQAGELAQMMGIESSNNPAVQVDMELQAAELAYRQSATANNYQDLLEKEAAYQAVYGAQTYYQSGGEYQVTVAPDGSVTVGVIDGQSLDNPETTRDEGQCGAFVNDVYGTSMGNTIDSKLKYTDDSISVPAAGMIFVRAGGYDLGEGQGDSGHTGIVESVDLANGTMNIVSANVNNDGKITRETVAITDAYSFGIPPDSAQLGATDDPYSMYYQQYKAEGETDEKARELAREQVAADEAFEAVVSTQVGQNAIAISTIDDILETVVSFGGTGGTALGRTLGQIVPGTEAADIASQLDTISAIISFTTLQEMRNNSKTGGALGQVSERELQLLGSVLGSISVNQSTEQFLENLAQIKDVLSTVNEAAYEDFAALRPADEEDDLSLYQNAAAAQEQTALWDDL